MIDTLHVSKPLSASAIVDIMDKYPNLEEITCAPSVYSRTPKKYIDALNKLDIEVNIKYNWGAKSKSDGVEFELLELYNMGFLPKEICEKTGLTQNRVYYLLRKAGATLNNYKRKHDYKAVYSLSHDGFTAQEISDDLNIPLRTVYSILEKID